MNSLIRKNLSFRNRNIAGIQNKEESRTLNNQKSFNHNKLRFLNYVDKSPLMNNLDKNITKNNNEQKSAQLNNIPNKKIILNKLLLNQIKKENEKESFQTRTNMPQIETIEINKDFGNKYSLSINNISSYRSKVIRNENKNSKKNLLMESHHLINSLLKNQNKIPKKRLNNDLELSLSTSRTKEQKIIKLDISPSKDSNKFEYENKNNNYNGELLYPANIKRINQTNFNENPTLNNSSFENNNKENKDINLVKNKKEILISPLYNLDSNNININTNRNRIYRSPLRMADVFMLKKHHSINPDLNNVLTEHNNANKEMNINKLKKITVIKNEKDKDKEKILLENIKRIRNLTTNVMGKEKENNANFKEKNNNMENINKENIKSINDNKMNNEKLIASIKETTIDANINENKERYHMDTKIFGRNNLFGIPKKNQISKTIDNKINKTISNIPINTSSINNIATISPIKNESKIIENVNNVESLKDKIESIKIKVNKIKLDKTIEERNEINRSLHSIRRRFMNSKNKYNNSLSPDIVKRNITNIENKPKEININQIKEENKQKTVVNEIKETPKINIINKTSETNIDNKNDNYNINIKEEESKMSNETLKNEETENIPEIKFQSESEKENRMKRNKKYKYLKKLKENAERNAKPSNKSNKLKKYNSFSFGTLFSLSSKFSTKNENSKYSLGEKSKKEENILTENDIKRKRYFSPEKKEINSNGLNIIIKEEEKTIKKINSDSNLNFKDIINNIKEPIGGGRKTKKKVTLSLDIKIQVINTSKPVIRYKISQLLPFNKLNKNQKKSNINLYIFGLDKSNIIKFDLRKKRFTKIKISDIEDISDSFQLNYIYENSLICNTLTGAFILTGEKTNLLYYYDKEHDIIIKLCQFNSCHNLGCLLLDKDKIYILGGKNNITCEYYDFEKENIELMPPLNNDRVNSSFCFGKNKIFSFFGYSYNKNAYLSNIEFIDKNLLDKWSEINLDISIEKPITNFSLFNFDKGENKIYIYGGKKEKKNSDENYYYIYDIEKNNFEKIENVFYNIKKEYKRFTVKKYDEEKNKNEFFFDKQKQFVEISEEFELDKNCENICVIPDSDNNIHFLTKNRNCVNIYQYLK